MIEVYVGNCAYLLNCAYLGPALSKIAIGQKDFLMNCIMTKDILAALLGTLLVQTTAVQTHELP